MSLKKRWIAVVAAVPLALAGCSAGAGDTAGGDDSSASGASITIEVVTHGAAGDIFWDVVKSGAMQAAKDLGVKVNYQGDGDAAKQSQLIDAAIANKPAGIVVSLANPEGVRDAVERAVAAGIPVIVTNKGEDQWKEYGAQTYVGQSEYVSGQEVGLRLAADGLKNVMCVVHEVGNIGNQDRCAGIEDKLAGGVLKTLQVDGSNLADAQNVVKSALLADPTIDGVVSLNPGVTPAAEQAILEAGSSAKLAAFEISADVLDLIMKDTVLFAVDQQPYLQGYLPVVFLTGQVRNGDVVGGGHPVYTGPGFVTKDNAEQILKFAKNGTR